MLFITGVITLFIWGGVQQKDFKFMTHTWLGWTSLGLLFFAGMCLLHRRLSFNISLSRKHEVGFFKKNWDKILSGLITSLLGALVGALITYFTKKCP